MSIRNPYLYKRRNGTKDEHGAGYVIERGGVKYHSVAWESSKAEQYRTETLDELGIECKSVFEQAEEEAGDEPSTEPDGSREPHEPMQTIVENAVASSQVIEPDPNFVKFTPNLQESSEVNIVQFLTAYPDAENYVVIENLHKHGIDVSTSDVSKARDLMTEQAAKEAEASKPSDA